MGRMPALSIASALLLLCTCVLPAAAQAPRSGPEGQDGKKAETISGKAGSVAPQASEWLGIAIEHRSRYESLDNRFRLGETGSDQQLALRTRVRVSSNRILKPVGLLFEFEDARVYLDDRGSTVTNSHVDKHDILQLYASVPMDRILHLPGTLFIGRQSFDLGSRRFFARNRFRNTTNAFDGFRWTMGNEKAWLLQAFAFQPVLRRMDQLDTRDHRVYFWGTFLSTARAPRFRSEFYYFGIHEDRPLLSALNRRHSTVGTRFFRDPRAGAVSFEFEAALQFGKLGSSDHLAHLEHVSADYSWNAPWRPMVTARYDYASGDRDPNDGRVDTFDPLFGARRWEYGPTGIYGAWSRANLNSPGWAVLLTPTKASLIDLSMRWCWLAQARDLWAGTRLRDATGAAGSYLGSQMELRLRHSFTKYLRADIGYIRFFKGSYLERVPGSPGALDSNYIYAEANISFEHFWR